MTTITRGAGDLGQLLDYLRATSCAHPNDLPAEHDHEGMCHEVAVARVAARLLDLIGDVAREGTHLAVGAFVEHAARLDVELQDDENLRHLFDAGVVAARRGKTR